MKKLYSILNHLGYDMGTVMTDYECPVSVYAIEHAVAPSTLLEVGYTSKETEPNYCAKQLSPEIYLVAKPDGYRMGTLSWDGEYWMFWKMVDPLPCRKRVTVEELLIEFKIIVKN